MLNVYSGQDDKCIAKLLNKGVLYANKIDNR